MSRSYSEEGGRTWGRPYGQRNIEMCPKYGIDSAALWTAHERVKEVEDKEVTRVYSLEGLVML